MEDRDFNLLAFFVYQAGLQDRFSENDIKVVVEMFNEEQV